MTYTPGIDVSHWQGDIHWGAVKAAGKHFAFIKATDGTSFVDPSFAENWGGAKAAGILRGAYHFFRPLQNARNQAELFLQTVEMTGEDLPPVLDLEIGDNLRSATIIERVETWMQAVEAGTGRKPIIYSGVSFLNDFFSIPGGGPPAWAKDHLLWIANYLGLAATQPNMPRGWDRWAIWQHSASGRVDGISGNVDLNWFNGTLDELFALVEAHPEGGEVQIYTVKGGDSLPSIAESLEIDLVDLLKANPQLLQPGMRLKLPQAGRDAGDSTDSDSDDAGAGGGSPRQVYVVRSGDTLSAIAARFNTTVIAIVQANHIEDPNLIRVGLELVIP